MGPVDDLELFDRLAAEMNANPSHYELLGDLDLDLVLVMRRADKEPFRVMLGFQGITCETVALAEEGQEAAADCWLDGDLADWEAMFANIVDNGRAVGKWTLNTLTIMGEQLRLEATDPMGWDKFHRFNQTLQEFFDATGTVITQEVS